MAGGQQGLRPVVSALQTFAFALGGILIALTISSTLLVALHYDPLAVYHAIWDGAFGDVYSFIEVLLKATPLILIGGGLAVAFRGSMWNIGAEGQLHMGAIAAAVIAIYLPLPTLLHLPLALLAGLAAGMVWGGLAGWMKARFGASEIVTTIMLNYVALILASYLVTGPMNEKAGGYPQSAPILPSAELWRLLPPTRLHAGLILALLLALALYLFIFHTSAGYAVRAVGFNPEAARYAGIDVHRNMVVTMAISGGMAGLAGAVELTGLTHRLYAVMSPGYGFEGIAVALLANNNPLGVIFSGVLFGALRSGSEVMQISAKVPSVLVFVIQGLAIIAIVTTGVVRLRWGRRREQKSSQVLPATAPQ
jgi:simple sugar transport system permease protein